MVLDGGSPHLLCEGDDVPLTFSSMLDVICMAWLTARTVKLTGKPRSAKKLALRKPVFILNMGFKELGMYLPTDLGGRGDGGTCVPAYLRRYQ